MKAIVVAAMACVFVTGCNSLGFRKAARWEFDGEACPQGACTQNDAARSYARALKYCRNLSNYYEASGNRATGGRFLIGTIGSLAGSVFAKTAKGSGATAWAGLSGTTNGIQTSLDEAFSQSLNTKRRKAIADAIAVGIRHVEDADTPQDAVTATMSMAGACYAAPSNVDAAAIEALAAQKESVPANARGATDEIEAEADANKEDDS